MSEISYNSKIAEEHSKKFMHWNGVKIWYTEEDCLSNIFCNDIVKCSEDVVTESTPYGCEGCEGMDEFIEYHYGQHVIEESDQKEFVALVDHKKKIKQINEVRKKCLAKFTNVEKYVRWLEQYGQEVDDTYLDWYRLCFQELNKLLSEG